MSLNLQKKPWHIIMLNYASCVYIFSWDDDGGVIKLMLQMSKS